MKLLEGVCPQLQETVLNEYNGIERQSLENRLGSHHVEEDVIKNNDRRQEVGFFLYRAIYYYYEAPFLPLFLGSGC